MAREILTRWQMPADFTDRVVWLVENHMKFHYFANFGEANGLKWVRSLARKGVFRSSKDMAEAFHQMTDLGNADIIGCGRPFPLPKATAPSAGTWRIWLYPCR